VGVEDGPEVAVGVRVGVRVGVPVGVRVGVAVEVDVGVAEDTGVLVGVGLSMVNEPSFHAGEIEVARGLVITTVLRMSGYTPGVAAGATSK
jgi:hypothetical protein